MKPFKVSIIVPVYNVEKYLSACLESLAAQTLEEVEIVAVNDGSTDGSLAVLKQFKDRYPWGQSCQESGIFKGTG